MSDHRSPLATYGRHEEGCADGKPKWVDYNNGTVGPPQSCTCGFSAARAAEQDWTPTPANINALKELERNLQQHRQERDLANALASRGYKADYERAQQEIDALTAKLAAVEAERDNSRRAFQELHEKWLAEEQEAVAALQRAEASEALVLSLREENKELRERDRVLSHQLERRADGMDPLTQDLRRLREEAESQLTAQQEAIKGLVMRWKAERERVAEKGMEWAGKKRGYEAAGICAGYETCTEELSSLLDGEGQETR